MIKDETHCRRIFEFYFISEVFLSNPSERLLIEHGTSEDGRFFWFCEFCETGVKLVLLFVPSDRVKFSRIEIWRSLGASSFGSAFLYAVFFFVKSQFQSPFLTEIEHR